MWPGLSSWAQSDHKGLYIREAVESAQTQGNVTVSGTRRETGRCYMVALKTEEGARRQGMWVGSRSMHVATLRTCGLQN